MIIQSLSISFQSSNKELCNTIEMEKKNIEIIRNKNQMRRWSRTRKQEGDTICLVPTMGSLHRGHLALVEEAKNRGNRVVVSIYVNPSQFAVNEDFSSYPSDFDGDLAKLKQLGVDAVFCPPDLYSRIRTPPTSEKDRGGASFLEQGGHTTHQTWVRVELLEQPLCGQSRPIFFRGVATVVTKLFNIVEPDVAIFGKKDYQQWLLICQMVHDLDFAVEIVGTEIVRDPDGLAMSSRNVNLLPEERQNALSISKSLKEVKEAVSKGEDDAKKLKLLVSDAIRRSDGKIDYVEVVDRSTLQSVEKIQTPTVLCVAAWFGKVRLIDNIELVAYVK